jgi:hypothetical protein
MKQKEDDNENYSATSLHKAPSIAALRVAVFVE